jgi:uroporphyrinogen decarboxylase
MGLLIDTLNGDNYSRPPVWFMRQAGRVLPNYLKLREKYSFKELMHDKHLCSEVTLMPVKELGVDAAILFSDILVVPEAMGMELEFTDNGPVFKNSLASGVKVDDLEIDFSKFEYIYENIMQIAEDKNPETDFIGFCGAPLTTLCYMVQGFSSNHTFLEAIKFLYQQKDEAIKLIDKITEASIVYATNQIKAGIDVFQLFDTHAGIIPNDLYEELFMPSVQRIAKAVRDTGTPFIFFPKGLGFGISKINKSICDAISIDWQTPIETAREVVDPEVILQGNLDPRLLFADKDTIEKELEKYKEFGKENNKWIFNLGHGFMPGIPDSNVKFVVDYIKNEF